MHDSSSSTVSRSHTHTQYTRHTPIQRNTCHSVTPATSRKVCTWMLACNTDHSELLTNCYTFGRHRNLIHARLTYGLHIHRCSWSSTYQTSGMKYIQQCLTVGLHWHKKSKLQFRYIMWVTDSEQSTKNTTQ